jgi:alkanesulfonate monooxygenase SsuD/methylene tetrahydromethanopterin reductase-like flavin-dependent oxidoreductase (luciferase family)
MFSEIQLAQSAPAAGTIQRQINRCCADRARFPQHRALREGARAVVGSAKDIADQLEQRFVERACDGFVATATHIPGAFEDFVRLVIPELQRRSLHHREYEGLTLRENLGLGLPRPGCWK